MGAKDVKVAGPFVQLVGECRELLAKLRRFLGEPGRRKDRRDAVDGLAERFPTLLRQLEVLRNRIKNSWMRTVPYYRETNLDCAAAADPIYADLEGLMRALASATPEVREPIESQLQIISSGLLDEIESLREEIRNFREEFEARQVEDVQPQL